VNVAKITGIVNTKFTQTFAFQQIHNSTGRYQLFIFNR